MISDEYRVSAEMIASFRDLDVWRKSHRLALDVFKLTETVPRTYLYDLTAQLRRAALSVPTNIAEGCATKHSKELLQFVNVAKRSASETQYLLLFASEQQLLDGERYRRFDSRYEEVNRMLGGLTRSLQNGHDSDPLTRHSTLVTRH